MFKPTRVTYWSKQALAFALGKFDEIQMQCSDPSGADVASKATTSCAGLHRPAKPGELH